jgi:hypothetical protein
LQNVDNAAAMPPLAKHLVDAEAVAAMESYLNGLTDEEFATDEPATTARYVRLTSLREINNNAWASAAEIQVLDGNGTPYSQNLLTVADVSSEETEAANDAASNAIDGSPDTIWHTRYSSDTPFPPHTITLDLGESRPIGGFTYLRRDDGENGTIAEWEFSHSENGESWTSAASGEWDGALEIKEWSDLIPSRSPRSHLAGPSGTVSGPFETVVTFDTEVTGLEPSDFEVTGGDVLAVDGSGYYYRARIQPSDEIVSVSLPAGVATAGGITNRAAADTVMVTYFDDVPPLPTFAGLSNGQVVAGPFTLDISFGERVSELEASDFSVSNGTVTSVSPEDDGRSQITILPDQPGLVTITLEAGAVSDGAGNVSTTDASLTVLFQSQRLAFEAEEGQLFGGMIPVDDPEASGGEAIWLPDNQYPGNFADLDGDTLNHRAEYEFLIPHSGAWLLRGLIEAANTEDDSFWVEVDGNQGQGEVYLWDTEVGDDYLWDELNHRDGAFGRPGLDPIILNLSAGPHTITVFARDDGTLLDRLELQSERPLVTLSTSNPPGTSPIQVSLTSSEPLQELVRDDFLVSGGSVQSLSGGSREFALTLSADGSGTTRISLPENVASDASGNGNFPSNLLTLTTATAYQIWATSYDLDSSEEAILEDPDRDGLETLLEYAFNLDPTKPSQHQLTENGESGLPRMMMVQDEDELRVAMEFLRRKSDTRLTYRCQFGSSLNDFENSDQEPVVESINENWERVIIIDEPAHANAPRRFGRVLVELP